ncbi:MAG: peptidoglycan-binding domain-containing protein [Candidatus Sulfotelmatobacter sp.]
MFERRIPIRKTGFGAVCIVIVACLTLATASFGQDAGDTTQKKPATAKKTTSRKRKSHHSASSTTKTTGKTHSASRKRSSRKKSARARGQQKIDGERAQAIQEALIREHYLSGEATGTWNQASEEAMRRYQADHGWQSKTVPDSRALIKLGLGPSKDHLLNPDSAMTTVPDAPKSQPMPTSSYSGPASANPVQPANPVPPAAPASTPAAASSSPQ